MQWVLADCPPEVPVERETLTGLKGVAGCAELERVLKLDMDSSQVMLGINNRDLQTFEVDIENNRRIMESSAGQQVRTI